MNRSRVILLTALLIGAGTVYHVSLPVDLAEREMTAEEYFASLNPETIEMDPNGLDRFRDQYLDLSHELDAMTIQQSADIIRKSFGTKDQAPSRGRLYPLEVSQ